MPGTPSDAELIATSRVDPQAFGSIFDRHFDAIYRYIESRVGVSLADDLAAETFCAAFASRGRFDPAWKDARPWLYGIATNLLRHHYRAEERRLRAYARSIPDAQALDVDAVADRVDATASAARVAAALAALKGRDRDVLLLFAGANQSYEEISLALAIPIGTVRSRLNRARRVVRELLGASGQYLGEECDTMLLRGEAMDERA